MKTIILIVSALGLILTGCSSPNTDTSSVSAASGVKAGTGNSSGQHATR